jgi:hypothetical protein
MAEAGDVHLSKLEAEEGTSANWMLAIVLLTVSYTLLCDDR